MSHDPTPLLDTHLGAAPMTLSTLPSPSLPPTRAPTLSMVSPPNMDLMDSTDNLPLGERVLKKHQLMQAQKAMQRNSGGFPPPNVNMNFTNSSLDTSSLPQPLAIPLTTDSHQHQHPLTPGRPIPGPPDSNPSLLSSGKPAPGPPGKPPPRPPIFGQPRQTNGRSPVTRFSGRGRPQFPQKRTMPKEEVPVKRPKQQKESMKLSAGSSCHQCKSRRSIQNLIFCTHVIEKTNKCCRKKYCEHCLRKFYGEELSEIESTEIWTCPSCRRVCCCAACRRREAKDKEPDYEQSPPSKFNSYSKSGYKDYAGYRSSKDRSSRSRRHDDYNQDDQEYSEYDGSEIPNSGNSSFALLYAVAQMPNVRSHIQQILARKDVADGHKVELIASLLRSAVRSNGPVSM